MSKKNIKPTNTKIIEDLETLKVIADPLRNNILEILTYEPLTVNQLSERLGIQPSKLYYHVKMLEKHEFIRVVDTTIHGNIIEKHYWLTAFDYDLGGDLLKYNVTTDQGKETIITMFTSIIDTTREDIVRSMEARAFNLEHGAEENPRSTLFNRVVNRVPDKYAGEFMHRLQEMLDEFDKRDDGEGDDLQNYALTIAMYPSFYYDESGEGNEKLDE